MQPHENSKGQSHLVNFAKGYLSVICHFFSNELSSKSTGPISIKFHMQPPGELQMKVNIFCLDHMTKVAAMSLYV